MSASWSARPVRGAVILAGGRGARLGGIDKASLRLAGERLLDRALAATADAAERVVVGEVEDARGATVVTESPRFGGPALALAAGAAALSDRVEVVDVLAVDLVHPDRVVAALDAWRVPLDADSQRRADASGVPGRDGAVLVADGRRQWLAARIRAVPLRRATAAARPDDSLRRILGPLDLAELAVPAELARDIDTLGDIADAGIDPPAAPQQEGAPR